MEHPYPNQILDTQKEKEESLNEIFCSYKYTLYDGVG